MATMKFNTGKVVSAIDRRLTNSHGVDYIVLARLRHIRDLIAINESHSREGADSHISLDTEEATLIFRS
jgi:hypothetical protein